jgi:S-adenosylmethionine-diacylglycerol 3-amino-3-carboxypropyl transferase
MPYFDKLNYTLANEDTLIEQRLLPKDVESVFSISGSGARVLPLIAQNPRTLDVVDVSAEQLKLTEIRLAAAKDLAYEEFLFFLGYRGALPLGRTDGDRRKDFFERLSLTKDTRHFWEKHCEAWTPRGFITLGRWESHFQKLGFIFRSTLRMNIRPIFEANSLQEQIALYEKHFNRIIFRSFLRLVANEYIFNRFLYKGHFSGTSERRTEQRPPWKVVDDEFHRLFTTTLVRRNYFLQVLFLGRIEFEEGLPLEAHRSTFEAIQESTTQVSYLLGDLTSLIRRRPYSFISLSDTISYLPADSANMILQNLHPETQSRSTVVIRSFLKSPAEVSSKGWVPLVEENKRAFADDGTGVYQFHIFRKI